MTTTTIPHQAEAKHQSRPASLERPAHWALAATFSLVGTLPVGLRRTILRASASLSLLLLVVGCATVPPSNPENICEIFREKSGWHKTAARTQDKWGVPPQVALAIVYQESSFRHDALPPRRYLLGFIPWGRVSSAYGYAQAKDETWSDYKREAGSWLASRDNFGDALDFMGWYMDKAQRLNGTSKWDAYGQYLNYHEGWTGYRNRSYNRKSWLKRVATKVQERAERFGTQYRSCKGRL